MRVGNRILSICLKFTACVAIFSCAFLFTNIVSADSYGGIGGRPANPDPANSRTQSIFIYSLQKSQAKADQVIISNNTNDTQTIDLYAVDGLVTNTGAFTCQQKAESNTDVGNWVKVSVPQVTLLAHENKKVDFSITAPSDADVGEHNGCLVFQTHQDEGQSSGNVRIRTRQAIRIVATIPGDLRKTVAIDTFNVSKSNAKLRLNLSIADKGNVSADVDAYVRIKSVFGRTIYSNGGGYPVLAGKVLDLTFINDKQPFFGGWFVASASATYDKRAGLFGTDDSSQLVSLNSKDIMVFIEPQPLADVLYSLVILLMLALIIVLFGRRIERVKAQTNWVSVPIRKGYTIQDYATEYHIGWKRIASINNIRAPYTLEVGKTILVPAQKEKR